MSGLLKTLREVFHVGQKKCVYNRDTHRVHVSFDIHACNECGGWETKSTDRNIRWGELIVHTKTCSFYPSLVNKELEVRNK